MGDRTPKRDPFRVVLFVINEEVFDALGNRMVGIDDAHLERTQRRVADVGAPITARYEFEESETSLLL
jgi:hypothetical protein